MEHVNPYAVMRNTKTFEAYRAYTRETTKAGQPFLFLALMMYMLAILSVGSIGRHSALPLAFGVAPVCLGGLFMAIAGLRMRRYRREHPIPDEWLQVPRTRWPAKPRL